ncbi:hypothetical protein [Paenibacillus dendrobii]|nr:hypothetical protein [Paenibacillus dendrobii]
MTKSKGSEGDGIDRKKRQRSEERSVTAAATLHTVKNLFLF